MGWQDSFGTNSYGNAGTGNGSYGNDSLGNGSLGNELGAYNNTSLGGYENSGIDSGYNVAMSYNPRQDISKQYHKIERDYRKLAEMQVGQQTGIVFEKNETWDANKYEIVGVENKSIHTRLPGTTAPASEYIIAQYMYRIEKQFEQNTGVLAQMGYNGDPMFRLSLADTTAYMSAKGLRFQHIDEITFSMQTQTGFKDVRHICDGGISLGKYEEVPLVVYDMVTRHDMAGNVQYFWKETSFPASTDRLKFYYCSRCGTVLYTYSI